MIKYNHENDQNIPPIVSYKALKIESNLLHDVSSLRLIKFLNEAGGFNKRRQEFIKEIKF